MAAATTARTVWRGRRIIAPSHAISSGAIICCRTSKTAAAIKTATTRARRQAGDQRIVRFTHRRVASPAAARATATEAASTATIPSGL